MPLLEGRRELAGLLAPQAQDNPRQQALKRALFLLVWRHCATTA